MGPPKRRFQSFGFYDHLQEQKVAFRPLPLPFALCPSPLTRCLQVWCAQGTAADDPLQR